MRNLFAFDLDDTLIPTHSHYLDALDGVLDVVRGAFTGDLTDEFIKRYQKINHEMEETLGFRRYVFRDSLIKTFEELAHDNGLNGQMLSEGLYYIECYSEIPFEVDRLVKAGTFDGALETLEFLVNEGNDLAIVTIGDDEFQKRKVGITGISDYVPENMVFADLHGKRHVLEELSRRGYDKKVFTGNSWKSDMVPAELAGYTRIYVQEGKSRVRDGAPQKGANGFIRLKGVFEIKDRYGEIINAS